MPKLEHLIKAKISENQNIGELYLSEILFTLSKNLQFFLHVTGLQVISSLSIPLWEGINSINKYCNLLLTVRKKRQVWCTKGLQEILRIHIIYVHEEQFFTMYLANLSRHHNTSKMCYTQSNLRKPKQENTQNVVSYQSLTKRKYWDNKFT